MAVARGCIPVTITLFISFFYARDTIHNDFCLACSHGPLSNRGIPVLRRRPKILQSCLWTRLLRREIR